MADAQGALKKVINIDSVKASIDNILRTHQGERVMTAADNAAGGGASGGVQFHFNGPVVGTQAWINSMIPQLSRALQGFQQINQSA